MQSVTRHDSEHPTIKGHGVQPGNRYPQKAPSLVTKRVQPSEILRHQIADRRPHHSHRSSREAQDNQHPFSSIQRQRTVRGSSLLSSSCCHMALRGHLSSDRRGETMPAHSSQQNKGRSPPFLTAEPSPPQPQRPLPLLRQLCYQLSARSLMSTCFVLRWRSCGHQVLRQFVPPRADGLNSGGHACQAVSAWPLHHSHPWKMYPAQGQSPGLRA